jgi:GDP-4-dehydro-6-deoxy-D-mannose reductase
LVKVGRHDLDVESLGWIGMKTILITGAQGFVGSYLIRELLLRGDWKVFGTRRAQDDELKILTDDEKRSVKFFETVDLQYPTSIQQVLDQDYDVVVHLAGVSRTEDAKKKPAEAWLANVGGTANLLLTLSRQRSSPPLTLFVSSLEVYGEGNGTPIREDARPNPVSVYATTKLAAEGAAVHIAAFNGIPLIIARPGMHAGRGMKGGLIPGWIRKLREGQTSVAFRGPSGVREILDVRDVVKAYLLLVDKGVPGETYNVATGKGQRFDAHFATLASGLKRDAQLVDVADPDLPDLHYSVGHGGKLASATGWMPVFSSGDTFSEMVKV